MSLSSFFSSFLPTVYADAPADDKEESKPEESTSEESTSEESKDEEPKDEEAGGEEEEEEEPEDLLPALREECQESAKCAPLTKHFQHCQEKVEAGKGFKHEDCIEELMMHCVDGCVAPKLFSKLK